MSFTFQRLSSNNWPDFEALLGEKGGCGGCWCMSWRVPKGGKTWEAMKGNRAKKAMQDLVAAGKAQGIMAYQDKKPAGWCTFGPRSDFPRLETVKAYQYDHPAMVWSVPCFFIAKEFRGKNLSFLLLEQVEAEAGKSGAKILEGYPAPLTKEGKKLPAAFAWMGPETIFQRRKFSEIQRLSASRPLYQKVLK